MLLASWLVLIAFYSFLLLSVGKRCDAYNHTEYGQDDVTLMTML